MKIRNKLLLTYASLSCLLILISFFYGFTSRQATQQYQEITADIIPSILLLEDIRYQESHIISHINSFVLLPSTELNNSINSGIEVYKTLIQKHLNLTTTTQSKYEMFHIQNSSELLINLMNNILELHKEIEANNNLFQTRYPEEKELRYNIQTKLSLLNDSELTSLIGDLQYHSEETLYQYKDQEHLDEWIGAIDKINVILDKKNVHLDAEMQETLSKYRNISLEMGKISIINLQKYNQEIQLLSELEVLKEKREEESKILLTTELEIYTNASKALERKQILIFELLIITTITALLTSIIISLVMSKKISSPILNLETASDDIAKGNFSKRVAIISNDEIGRLTTTFNNMTDTIEKNIANLNNDKNALHKAYLQLQELDVAKTEFLNMTSHELKTPLTPTTTNLELMLDGTFGKLTKTQKNKIINSIENLNHLKQIIELIIEISDLESNKLVGMSESMDLNKLVKSVTNKYSESFKKKGINIRMDLSNIPLVYGNTEKIMRCIDALISNALKFTKKGTVTISTRKIEQNIMFKITDTGIGITKENIKNLFSRMFYQESKTLAGKAPGIGMGLYYVNKVIQLHKGNVGVKSELGKGSEFYFTLPIEKPINI